jgi:hypothetical protein
VYKYLVVVTLGTVLFMLKRIGAVEDMTERGALTAEYFEALRMLVLPREPRQCLHVCLESCFSDPRKRARGAGGSACGDMCSWCAGDYSEAFPSLRRGGLVHVLSIAADVAQAIYTNAEGVWGPGKFERRHAESLVVRLIAARILSYEVKDTNTGSAAAGGGARVASATVLLNWAKIKSRHGAREGTRAAGGGLDRFARDDDGCWEGVSLQQEE